MMRSLNLLKLRPLFPKNISSINYTSLRHHSNSNLNRPGPIPLPAEDQAEFEMLQKQAEERARILNKHPQAPEEKDKHRDFEGDVNPVTGEIGGPKQDPLIHGDYSFNGRVTDF